MDSQLPEYFTTAVAVAKAAGAMISEVFHKEKAIEIKSNFADLLTETDTAVEDMIISSLRKKYPTHKFIGEESVYSGQKCELTDNPTWIIDPIDGTTNFVHRIPQVCVVIALAINKEIVLGVTFVPEMDLMFTAQKGHGAYLNGVKISASPETELKRSIIIAEAGFHPDIVGIKLDNVRALLAKTHGHRSYGSAAYNMCMIACGRGEAYYDYGIHIWDYAAGVVIVREAGGVVMDPTGSDVDLRSRRVLCAGTQSVATELSSLLTHVEMERD